MNTRVRKGIAPQSPPGLGRQVGVEGHYWKRGLCRELNALRDESNTFLKEECPGRGNSKYKGPMVRVASVGTMQYTE
jgi:hypothetical protein